MNELLYFMKKLGCIFKGMTVMIKKHKLYFLAPICLILLLIVFLIYHVAPAVVVSFIYAGI
jgi:hypothetical protein